eukprot:3398381-Rhodomonas_salina.1
MQICMEGACVEGARRNEKARYMIWIGAPSGVSTVRSLSGNWTGGLEGGVQVLVEPLAELNQRRTSGAQPPRGPAMEVQSEGGRAEAAAGGVMARGLSCCVFWGGEREVWEGAGGMGGVVGGGFGCDG